MNEKIKYILIFAAGFIVCLLRCRAINKKRAAQMPEEPQIYSFKETFNV